jgi:hypothetical protein
MPMKKHGQLQNNPKMLMKNPRQLQKNPKMPMKSMGNFKITPRCL